MEYLTDEQKEEYKRAFDLFDRNGDGRISKKELKNVLKTLGQKTDSKTVAEMMKDVDLNKDGSIDFEEFTQYMNKHFDKEGQHQQETLDAFQVYDKNGDGYIEMDEVLEVMKSIDLNVTEEEAKNMIDSADINGDGKVDLKEFAKFMRHLDPDADRELNASKSKLFSSFKRKK